MDVLDTLDTVADRVPLARSLGYHIRQLSESFTGAIHVKLDAHGVTQGQWRYLRELWEQDGLSQRELSERVGRQGPTTVAALKLLERSGYAVIERNETDRRKTHVYLTQRGRTLEADAAPILREFETLTTEGLSDEEVKTFKRLLVRIQSNVDRENRQRNWWAEKRARQLAEELGD